MASLATDLENIKPRRRQSTCVQDILDALHAVDREAVRRALVEYDDEYEQYRVSSQKLAETLTAHGHKVSQTTIAKYRRGLSK